MLSAFYTEHGGQLQSEAQNIQWLRRRFPTAAAAEYGELDGDGDYGGKDPAGAGSSDAAGTSRDQQHGDVEAVPGAALHAAAPQRIEQQYNGTAGEAGDAAAAAAPLTPTPGAAANAAAPPQPVRRSSRLHTAADPVFSSSLADFAQLSLRPQQQKQQHRRPSTAAQH